MDFSRTHDNRTVHAGDLIGCAELLTAGQHFDAGACIRVHENGEAAHRIESKFDLVQHAMDQLSRLPRIS